MTPAVRDPRASTLVAGIPERYRPLGEAVQGYYGVRVPLADTLNRYFNGPRDTDAVVEGFEVLLLRNWTYFERSGNREELVLLVAELLAGLVENPLSNARLSSLLRAALNWSSALLDGPHADVVAAGLRPLAESLGREFHLQPTPFLERDGALRSLVRKASGRAPIAGAFSDLYRSVLKFAYRRVIERLDLAAWAGSGEAGLADPARASAAFDFLERARVSALLQAAEAAPDSDLLWDAFPAFSKIADEAIERAFRIENLEDRFAACLRLLEDDTLGYRRDRVASDLPGELARALGSDDCPGVERLLDRLAAFFRDREEEYVSLRFGCYEALGVAIGKAGHAGAAERLVSDALSRRFQHPETRGVTDDWETVVNPHHIRQVRSWMRVIGSNPQLYDKLAAALDIQLRLGGVHLADTDLFQRDVSGLLAADIRPVYFIAKQLLRTLPVYFNEVGAEGELRAVTTEADELSGRRDTVVHSLRKQSHTESSNRLAFFSRALLRYWTTLDTSGLEPFVSAATLEAALRQERCWAEAPHAVLQELMANPDTRQAIGLTSDVGADASGVESFLDHVVALPPERLGALLGACSSSPAKTSHGEAAVADGAVARRRVALLVRIHQLLAQKYSLTYDRVGNAVARAFDLDGAVRGRFESALVAWQVLTSPANRDALLDAALAVLEGLKDVILSDGPAVPAENLYRKRHVAAGIPSIYGSYNERRFDALSLSLRVEQLTSRLLDDVAAEGLEPYLTRDSLRRMAQSLRRFQRALAVDGIASRTLSSNLDVLEASFAIRNFRFSQYRDILQFLGSSIAGITSASVACHEWALGRILANDPRPAEAHKLEANAVSEMVLREALVSALGLQALDRYLGAAIRQVSALNEQLSNHALTRMMNYDPWALVSFIHAPIGASDDQTSLGLKGLGLKQMASYGYRVPEGFILTTELFDARPALSCPALLEDVERRLREALGRLEKEAGLRLGDPGRPLLLSVRSGAAVSMPGMMTTFVNAGVNEQLAEEISRRPGFEWAAWDCYRRFIQSWAMSSGADRDLFDAFISEFKKRRGVERKIDFTPADMRAIARGYKELALEAGVAFVDDLFRQVVACVFKVLDSWESPHAGLYREYMGIAEEWGTAVIVQRMVFGNIGRHAGSGVVFTHDPVERPGGQLRLAGDFAVQCQGEDLVGGLVFPLPVSEAQRRGSSRYRAAEDSLEKKFPEVHAKLLSVALDLACERGFGPQEIEFTFESPAADHLFILQKRPAVAELPRDWPCIDTLSPGYREPIAFGTGVAGGAYCGRAAVNPSQIDRLLGEHPEDDILLLRPDTVPEDIGIIARVGGILTARGGATSHAAVTARRLGKTAVVGCVDLEVKEHGGSARLAATEIGAGDWLTVDGRTGNIFIGRMAIVSEKALVRKALNAERRSRGGPRGRPQRPPATSAPRPDAARGDLRPPEKAGRSKEQETS